MMKTKETYIAFLRGINVGGHHKVPMAQLKTEFEKMGYEKCTTLLNSGNVIFDGSGEDLESMALTISKHIGDVFGFPIPTRVVEFKTISNLLKDSPFEGMEVTKDTRLYVSFLPKIHPNELRLPWVGLDDSFQILEKRGNAVCSVLDVSQTQTPKGMEVLERSYGKEITTRNWNTLQKISEKINKS